MTCSAILWLGLGFNLLSWIGVFVYWSKLPPKRDQTRLALLDKLVPPSKRKSSGDQ